MKILKKIFGPLLRGAIPPTIFGLDDAASIGLGSLIVGAGSSVASGIQAGDLNRENREFAQSQANSAQNFAREQTIRQQEYGSAMANSAYQRATADMEKAGINPALAFMKGGADSPQGSAPTVGGMSPSGQQAPRYENPIPAAVSTAAEINRLKNENLSVTADINKKVAETATSASAADVNKAQKQKIEAETTGLRRVNKTGSVSNLFGEPSAKILESTANSAKGFGSVLGGVWDQINENKQRHYDWQNNEQNKRK